MYSVVQWEFLLRNANPSDDIAITSLRVHLSCKEYIVILWKPSSLFFFLSKTFIGIILNSPLDQVTTTKMPHEPYKKIAVVGVSMALQFQCTHTNNVPPGIGNIRLSSPTRTHRIPTLRNHRPHTRNEFSHLPTRSKSHESQFRIPRFPHRSSHGS